MTLRAFILAPTVIFQAEVASNPADSAYPVDQLTFDTVTTGAFGDIQVGQLVTFGTASLPFEHGVQRIRKAATADTIYIGRTSKGYSYGEIGPTGTSVVRVWDLRAVWTKPYFEDVDTSTSPPTATHYKDGDIAYSDQTTEPPPVANTGPGTMATIDGSNIITVEFDGTASFAVADGATISTYLWDVDDGSITVGTSASDTITATFPAGFRYVSLTVTDSNGKTHTAYCPVFARNPASDLTIPIDGLTIRQTQEGQEAIVQLTRSLPESTYPDNTLVMAAFGEPSSASDRSHLKFVGWHHRDSADHRAERTGYITGASLTCLDVAGKMQVVHGFSQKIEHAASPATWGKMSTANMDKLMHYLLQWHSNVLDLADWTWSGTGATYAFSSRGANPGTLWDQVKAQGDEMNPTYRFTCNSLGQLAVIVDPMVQSALSRTSTVQTTIDESEWSNLRYDHERYPRYFWLWGGAVIASNSLNADGEFDLVFCVAPGTAPGIGYTEMRDEVGITPNQATLNTTYGHRYARMNAPERPFRITLTGGNDHGIEPAEMTWVQLTLAEDMAAAPRGLSLSAARGLPLELTKRWNVTRTGVVKSCELVWERETNGVDAVTVIPEENADDIDTGLPDDYTNDNVGDITVPVSDLEPPPIIPPGAQNIVLVERTSAIYRTNDFQTASGSGGPTWDQVTLSGGLTIYDFVVDPFSPGYLGTGTEINGYIVTTASIRKITDMFAATPTVEVLHTFDDNIPSNGGWRSIDASFGAFFAQDNPWIIVVSHYVSTAGTPGTWAIYSTDAGQTWSDEIQISEHYTTDSPGTYEEMTVWASPRTPGYAITTAYTSTAASPGVAAYFTTDWGENWAAVPNAFSMENRLAPAIHVPFESNEDEGIIYYGAPFYGPSEAVDIEHRLYKQVNGVSSDISPEEEDAGGPGLSRFYGVGRRWGIRSSDIDGDTLVVAGRGNDYAASTAGDRFGVWTSIDGGDNWSEKIAISTNTKTPRSATFLAGSSTEIIAYGRNWYIQYSDDFGGTWDSREGNLATLAGGNRWIRGIAGGVS